ncbi:hypothetical protein AAFN85_18540 [Mucilaginibacter sp. CAU 1740]|uniref:hypothetical protein n=1 Tax=Mucilaginibacter sp. CAU 1740 TaxID=3140365 RepID=UPI00325AA3CE
MKFKIAKTEEHTIPYIPENPKSYAIDEVLAAGGATAFANKMGKSLKDFKEKMASFSPDSFLTDEELKSALETLNASK